MTSVADYGHTTQKLLGYPGEQQYGFYKDSRYQYETDANITNVFDRYFDYNGLCYEGMSGGPIYNDSTNIMYGFNTGGWKWYGITMGRYGCRFTDDMIYIIADNR